MDKNIEKEILEQWGFSAPWLQKTLIKKFIDSLIAGRSSTWLGFLVYEFGLDDEDS